MKISLNWLRQHIGLTETAEQIAELLTNCGLEVEDFYGIGEVKGNFQGLVVGHVLEVTQHPNADRLKLTMVDIGSSTILNIVCGAPNVEVGQKVITAPVGVTIYPLTGEPLTMRKAKIRGVESEGMICAEDEIGLGNSHDGILILDNNCIPGAPVSNYLKTDSDVIFEIGLTPNRGDAASHLGVARDLKAILNRPIIRQILVTPSYSGKKSGTGVKIEKGDLCGRYSGLIIEGVTVKPSPDWLQKSLKAIDIHPVNNVVDITNYIMHDVGQPMHAFDADKINGDILVRFSKPGESLTTLDKVDRKLSGSELIITDDSGPIALAGVMGGLSSSITSNTTRIFLESACFNAAKVRKTAKQQTLNTDSSFRFERGIDPHNTADAMVKAAHLILEIADGKIASEVIDVQPEPLVSPQVTLSFKKLKTLAGVAIETPVLKNILENLDVEILSENETGLELKIPLYRTDVTRDIDVIEDILRIHGFDNIPLPRVMNSAAIVQPKPDRNMLKQVICNYLSAHGFNEVMTNSLTRESYFNDDQLSRSINLLNPLSNELALLRPDLLPSMLEAIAYNKNRKAHDLKFYEFGRVYFQTETGFKEVEKLAICVTGNKKSPDWRSKPEKADYYYLKSVLESSLNAVGVNSLKGTVIKEVEDDLLKKLDIKGDVWYAEVNFDQLLSAHSKKRFVLNEIPVFPEVSRDVSLVLEKEVLYSEIDQLINKTAGKYLRKITLTDVFEGQPLQPTQRSYTVNLILYDSEKTMTDDQIDTIMQKLIVTFENQLNATIRK